MNQCHMPRRTMSTSAPTISQKLATSFIKVILVAKKEFAAYFVSSHCARP